MGASDVYSPTFNASGTDTLEILPFIYHHHDSNSVFIPCLTESQRMSASASGRRLDFVPVASPSGTYWIQGIYAGARVMRELVTSLG